jgi:hypothetical protein
LLCLIAACGVTNSKKPDIKFNPHIDGVWAFQAIVSIPCDNKPTICDQFHDIFYVLVDYPNIHACYERLGTVKRDPKIIKATKEDLKVVHKKGNLYKIKTENGDPVDSDTLTIKMKIDKYLGLGILKREHNGRLEGFNYRYVSEAKGRPGKKDYQECRKNATYSKDALRL